MPAILADFAMTHVHDWLAHHARYSPNATAAIDLASQRTFTYAQFNDRASRLACGLKQQYSITKGDRIALLCRNSTDMLEMLFACQKLGAIFVPLNWRLTAHELAYIVGDSAPTVLMAAPEFDGTTASLCEQFPQIRVLRMTAGKPSPYEALIQDHEPAVLDPGVQFDDTWILMYTSGTTGRPKGALITHGMVFFTAVNTIPKVGISSASRCLTFLPLFHVGGLLLFATTMLYAGGSIAVTAQFDAADCLGWLADAQLGISHVFGVPTNFLFMSQLPQFASADLSALQTVLVGGAPASLDLLETWLARDVSVQQGWGMTETATLGTILSADRVTQKLGSSGLPVMHTEIRIMDDDGHDVANGVTGELWVKGPTVTPGYWNNQDAQKASFHDGWFKTGDAAYADEESFIYIVDRWKDMYISGGENVYPAEVESALYRNPEVAEAAVIGIPDKVWGQVGCAFIALLPGRHCTEAILRERCAQLLAPFKRPKRFVFVEALPHNAAGKILKHELRSLLPPSQT